MTKTQLRVTKIQFIPCYRFFSKQYGWERLDFIPVDNVPGFSHRVAYNGNLTKKYFSSDFKINQKNALDMLDIIRHLNVMDKTLELVSQKIKVLTET